MLSCLPFLLTNCRTLTALNRAFAFGCVTLFFTLLVGLFVCLFVSLLFWTPKVGIVQEEITLTLTLTPKVGVVQEDVTLTLTLTPWVSYKKR